jgi:hypothetical protein
MAMGILMTTTPFMGTVIPIRTPMTTIIVIRGMIQGLTVLPPHIAMNMDMVRLTTITPGIPMTTIMHILTTLWTHTGMNVIYQVLMCTGKKGWAYGSFSC